MEQITRHATAGAKINLFLSIGARRADGYHEIDTVMQVLPFGDAVSLCFEAPQSGEQTVLFTTNRPYGEAEKNLGVIAVRAYCRAAGISAYRAILQIEKRIPAGAGFGGGSADAAAVLRLCEAQFGALQEPAMYLLCTAIGADVPFCYAGGCFRARGIGEKLEKLPPLAPCHVLLAIGKESAPTAWAYSLADRLPPQAQPGAEKMLSALHSGALPRICDAMYNRFEAAVFPARPQALALRKALLCGGADGAMLSGSGAGVFGIFSPEKAAVAEKTLAQLRQTGYWAELCTVGSAERNKTK